ncbi:MAG: glycoside hydrolase family 13 [Nitrospira sp.]|nr:glycoside hydrolase family 13 [Nitrospira sp.]MBH0183231.1 glycoside hydrolase family 13 [Nitrospira sp.]MBH0186105.1 glycoside hydrolase family 13 [Nitrospira sp.]
MIAAQAAQLPKIVPSAAFLSRVKAQTTPPAPSLWERLRTAVTVPRRLEWNLAGAMAAACVAVLAIVGLLKLAPDRIVEVPVAVPPVQTASFFPTSTPQVFVRLVLVQPGARSVSVAGDFNGWNPAHTKLDRADGGVWTVTIPLKPGRYEYMFVVDGKQWIADPLAAEDAGDGFGSHNAVLDVAI